MITSTAKPRALRGALLVALIACALLATSICATARGDALLFHATTAGQQTLDQGEGGGNPFASSLIELLQRPRVALSELSSAIRALTSSKSRGFQSPDVPTTSTRPDWLLVPPKPGERRIALVLIVSDYVRSARVPENAAPSLPGARHDAQRIAAALAKAGFTTEIALDLPASDMRRKLAEFSERSKTQDAAVIYTTGHGVEVGGQLYLLPGDYPVEQRNAALERRAILISDIAEAPRAAIANLVFYGGCRDNPFAE
jgi:hypothetical protein